MQEALTLFDSICNSRWFVKTSIVRSPPPCHPTFYLTLERRFFSSTRLIFSPKSSLAHRCLITSRILRAAIIMTMRASIFFIGWSFLTISPRSDCENPSRFVSLNQSALTKQIYAHYTCATDTQQIKCTSSYLCHSLTLADTPFP